jgi:rfaE bifunctional protein kinase chain/domain
LTFSQERLEQIFLQFKNKKILVVGDVMVDEYLRGNVTRLSPEAPVPIVEIEHEEVRLGGAANVALNVKSLHAEPLLVGVVGEDRLAEQFFMLMNGHAMDKSNIIRDMNRPTTSKTRIIGDNQHIARVDKENIYPVSNSTKQKVIKLLQELIPEVDAIIMEDYNKGVLIPEIIEFTIEFARKNKKIVTVDPKFINFMKYRGATLFKPNVKEASGALGIDIRSDSDVSDAGKKLLKILDVDCVLLTRGAQGISLIEANGKINHIPTKAKTVADVSGAGDTVISTMTVSLAGNASFLEAAILANIAAGAVCEEVGIVPIELELFKSITLNT